MPLTQFQQPRWQREPYSPSQTYLYAATSLMGAVVNPMPLTYEPLQPPPQHSNRSSNNFYVVKFTGSDAPQVLAAVKLNGVHIEGGLIDSGSSFLLIASSTLSALPERTSVEQFMHRPPNIVGVGGSSAKVLG